MQAAVPNKTSSCDIGPVPVVGATGVGFATGVVPVLTGLFVRVGVALGFVLVGVTVAVGVLVVPTVLVGVKYTNGVVVTVGVLVGVLEGVAVFVGVAVLVGVAVAVGVLVGVGVGVFTTHSSIYPSLWASTSELYCNP